jgi:hypothetical protein
MGKKIQITESQFKRLMKTITEAVSGYDDFHVMYQHGGKSIAFLLDTMRDLLNVFKGIEGMLTSDNIEYTDLKENFNSAIDLIDEITKVMKVVFKDFADRKTIRKGNILLRTLESYQEKLRTTFSFKPEDVYKDDELKERLAILTNEVALKLHDYALELRSSTDTFKSRVLKGRDKQNPNMN